MKYKIGDRIVATEMDERGFVTRTEALVDDTDEDHKYYIVRPLKVRCYHPCNPEGGRDLPPPRGFVLFTEEQVQ